MSVEHFDVLVVGGGISGIAAGYYLRKECPGKRYAILEGRRDLGGTWDLFRYPGIRSDSDMYTLGFSFHPWRQPRAIAGGPAILNYLRQTARAFRIDRRIRYEQRVRAASWSSEQSMWCVEVEVGPERRPVRYTCRFLFLCCGYYDYEQGHAPAFAGSEEFEGRIIHPQRWPEDLDYRGRRVVVIGSGATAVTLVPALAEKAAHVTMLQRSPSYILSVPTNDRLGRMLRRLLPEWLAFPLIRWRNILLTLYFYRLCRQRPEQAKKFLRHGLARELPPDFAIDVHFKPQYEPWDQRLCIVPDADLLRSIRDGRASVVTDEIERFTRHGIRLKSGQELPADLIVTATGLRLLAWGGIALAVDGTSVQAGDCVAYRGLMLSNVPNCAFCVGYTNASWTLRAELVAAYVCRLLRYMDRHAYTQCMPRYNGNPDQTQSLLSLTSGYVRRGMGLFPRQGAHAPWLVYQNYIRDLFSLGFGRVDDGALEWKR